MIPISAVATAARKYSSNEDGTLNPGEDLSVAVSTKGAADLGSVQNPVDIIVAGQTVSTDVTLRRDDLNRFIVPAPDVDYEGLRQVKVGGIAIDHINISPGEAETERQSGSERGYSGGSNQRTVDDSGGTTEDTGLPRDLAEETDQTDAPTTELDTYNGPTRGPSSGNDEKKMTDAEIGAAIGLLVLLGWAARRWA